MGAVAIARRTDCFIPTWVKPKRNERGDWIVFGPDGSTPIAMQKKGVLYFETIHWPLQENPRDLDRLEEAIGYTMWASAAMASPPGLCLPARKKGRGIWPREPKG